VENRSQAIVRAIKLGIVALEELDLEELEE
jgi:hypothetical protein